MFSSLHRQWQAGIPRPVIDAERLVDTAQAVASATSPALWQCSACGKSFRADAKPDLHGLHFAHPDHPVLMRCLDRDELRALKWRRRVAGYWVADIASDVHPAAIARLASVRQEREVYMAEGCPASLPVKVAEMRRVGTCFNLSRPLTKTPENKGFEGVHSRAFLVYSCPKCKRERPARSFKGYKTCSVCREQAAWSRRRNAAQGAPAVVRG